MRYEDVVMRDGPLGLWPLQESEGSTATVQGIASAGSYSGSGHTYQRAGPSPFIPFGVKLDGAAAYVQLDVSTFLLGTAQPQAFEAWINLAADISPASAQKIVWGSTAVADIPIDFGGITGSYAGEVIGVLNNSAGSGDSTAFDSFTIKAGWHHHVMTYDGVQNGWNWYMDGFDAFKFNGRLSASGGAFGFSGSQTWTLGKNSTSTFTTVEGLAMVAIYKRHLPIDLARDHYVAGTSGLYLPDRQNLR